MPRKSGQGTTKKQDRKATTVHSNKDDVARTQLHLQRLYQSPVRHPAGLDLRNLRGDGLELLVQGLLLAEHLRKLVLQLRVACDAARMSLEDRLEERLEKQHLGPLRRKDSNTRDEEKTQHVHNTYGRPVLRAVA